MPHFSHIGAVSQAGMSKRGGRKRTHLLQHGSVKRIGSKNFFTGNGIGILPEQTLFEGDRILEKLMLDGCVVLIRSLLFMTIKYSH